jgi:iron complex outermembrane receptor protein
MKFRSIALAGVALTCMSAMSAIAAEAQSKSFNVPSEDAVNSIPEFARQAGVQIVAPAGHLGGLKTAAIRGDLEVDIALQRLLRGTGLQVASNDGQTIALSAVSRYETIAPQNQVSGDVGGAPEMETVVVTGTGSLIRGISAVGSNLISVDAEAMKQAGALTANQILEQVPQLANAFNTNVAAPTAGNFSGFRPQIRSLPSQNIVGGAATLLLLDGQNMVGVGGLGTAPDASVIPTIALRRVDVLPDGASATYGANAITGVINFITRDRFDGLQLEADIGTADGYTSFNTSAIGGTSWASGSAYLAVQHTDNTVLLGGDRDYSKMDLTGIGGRDSRSTACALPNITAGPRNYAQTGYPANTPGALRANVTGPYPALNSRTNAGSLNRCDTNAITSIFPSVSQTGVFGSFRQTLMDGVEFSTKVLWNSRLQYSLNPVAATTSTITASNPFFQSIAGETSQRVQYSFSPYLGKANQRSYNRVDVFQVIPQLTAALPWGDWEMIVTGNYSRSATNTTATNGLDTALLTTAISTGVGGQYVDPYNVNLTDSNLLDKILGFKSGGTALQKLVQAQVSFDGSLFELPGGPVKMAIGGKYDWEGFYSTLNVGVIPGQPYRGSHRVVTAGFGQINVPVVGEANRMPLAYSLALDVSGRIDNYSDFGSTANFKLGLSWQPFEELTLRATRGTSYDAPSLADMTPNQGRLVLSQHNTPNPIVPPGTSLADQLRPSVLVPGTNEALRPELGSTWSLGADLRPSGMLEGFDFGATYYHVSIEHQIGLLVNNLQLFSVPSYSNLYILNPTAAQVVAYNKTIVQGFPGNDVASGYPPFVTPDQTPYILYDARRNNLGNSILSGLDFNVNYAGDFDFGALTAGLSGTYSFENKTAGSAAGPFVSIQSVGVPLYAASAFTQLVSGPLSLRGSVQYTPGFRIDPATQAYTLYGQRRAGSFVTVNFHAGYDLTGLTSWTSDTEIGLTVNNLLDAEPPIYLHGGTVLPANSGIGITANGSTLGRYFLLSLQKTF